MDTNQVVLSSAAGGPALDTPVPKPSNIWVLVRPSRLVQPADLFHCGANRREKWADFLQLFFADKSKRQTNLNKCSPKECNFYKMSGPGQTRYYFVLSSRDRQFWDISFLFVLMHLICRLAETILRREKIFPPIFTLCGSNVFVLACFSESGQRESITTYNHPFLGQCESITTYNHPF
jgi:hypothetical protein